MADREKEAGGLKAPGTSIKLVTKQSDMFTSLSANIKTPVILVTQDKVKLCLIEHSRTMERRHAWSTPFGVLVSTLGALATSNFHGIFGVRAEQWQSLFVVGAFISGIWLIVKLCTMPKCKTIDEIIDQLKSTAVETDQQSESEPGRQQTT